MKALHEDYLRSILFGLQDGLVSTTGVVVGVSIGGASKEIIILASIVAVTVESSSMAAGQYSSEKAVHQMDKTGRHDDSLVVGATLMFISYFLAGLVPILPVVILGHPGAWVYSIIASFIALFVVGYVKGKLVEHAPIRSAIELFLIGGAATLIGLVVGSILKV